MGSLSNYAEAALLDHALKTASFTVPTNIYIALSTADPGEAGAGLAEPVGNNYARVAHNVWDAAANRATENTGLCQFPTASGSWGLITHWALFDAITGGNMLAHGTVTSGSFTPTSGDAPKFVDGEIDISFSTGGASTYLANKLLDHMLKTAAYTQPTNIYAGLSTANPGDSASGLAEPGSGSYARVLNNSWAAVASGATSNSATITFPEATGAWGTVTHGAIFDALTTGNMLIYGALAVSKDVISGHTLSFASGDFDITID